MSAAPGLATVRAASFPELVATAKGRHPIELLSELQGDLTPHAQLLAREASTSPIRLPPLPQGDGLALPHPLDAEWRFSADTAHALVMRAVDATRVGDKILLLGVPMVILAAAQSDVDRRFVAVCEDNVIGQGLVAQIAHDRRFQDIVAENCAAAIVDPPWYPKVFAALLGQAAAACEIGGVVLIGAPPLGVRPTAGDERQDVLATAARIGLALTTINPEALIYRTPAFEAAAMQAAGVHLWLPTWRRGDLLVFRKDQVGCRPSFPPVPPAFELTLVGVRMRLVAGPIAASDGIVPVVEGEVFPSVSARTPGRARANLWTSGNRAFSCPPAATLAALKALAAQHDLWPKGLDQEGTESADSTSIDPIHLVAEIARIAARDLARTAALVGESSWNRAANDARFLNGSEITFRQTQLGAAG